MIYIANNSFFENIPGKPIAYWATKQVVDDFNRGISLKNGTNPRVGLQTSDNETFIRQWEEVDSTKISTNCLSPTCSLELDKTWYFHNKGGAYRKWYGNLDIVLNYKHNGELLRNNPRAATIPDHLVFREQISFSRLGGKTISARYFPAGMTFDSAAVCLFPPNDIFYYVLSFLNSKVIRKFTDLLSPTLNVQPGDVGKIPLILCDDKITEINQITKENIFLSKKDFDSFETSWDFKKHPLI